MFLIYNKTFFLKGTIFFFLSPPVHKYQQKDYLMLNKHNVKYVSFLINDWSDKACLIKDMLS